MVKISPQPQNLVEMIGLTEGLATKINLLYISQCYKLWFNSVELVWTEPFCLASYPVSYGLAEISRAWDVFLARLHYQNTLSKINRRDNPYQKHGDPHE